MGRTTDRLDPGNKLKRLSGVSTFRRTGRVAQIVGLTIESDGPPATLGELCWVDLPDGSHRATEVVGFRDSRLLLMPLGELEGIGPGLTVRAAGRPLAVPIASEALGRVLDGLGRPIDNKPPFICDEYRALNALPPDPLKRERVSKPLPLGVRVIDAFLTCGMGQRIGIFGGSGVGKSSILGMFARYAKADVNVIALIGERGREVRDFIERDLGPEGLARSVVVVVTSDQPALLRIKGALTAASIAEYFRDQGANVLLMMDSVTRLCMAQREVGLAVGEPPTTRGYVPSVFSLLPKLLERSGIAEKGSVTGLYTVLVEGDDMNEPVADAVRSHPGWPRRPLPRDGRCQSLSRGGRAAEPEPRLPGHRRTRASCRRRPNQEPDGRSRQGPRFARCRGVRGGLQSGGGSGAEGLAGNPDLPQTGAGRSCRI